MIRFNKQIYVAVGACPIARDGAVEEQPADPEPIEVGAVAAEQFEDFIAAHECTLTEDTVFVTTKGERPQNAVLSAGS